jgi:hypothetical protein
MNSFVALEPASDFTFLAQFKGDLQLYPTAQGPVQPKLGIVPTEPCVSRTWQ